MHESDDLPREFSDPAPFGKCTGCGKPFDTNVQIYELRSNPDVKLCRTCYLAATEPGSPPQK